MKHSKQDILDYVKNHPAGKVKLAIVDIDGVLRGKVVHVDKFLSVAEGGFGFCDVVFGWDIGDVAYDNAKITGWHTGYPDAPARIDLSTFRKIPWEDGLPFFLADFTGEPDQATVACPRGLLKKINQRADDMGYKPFFSQEFEWFTFEETPASLEEIGFQKPRPITPGMFGYSILRSSYRSDYFNDIFDQLKAFDVAIEGLHTETGPGVYEAAIMVTDILQAADMAALFKTGVKEIAYQHDYVASFMAKWDETLPGCSGHIHQSIWDKSSEKNLFFNETASEGMSDLMKSYLAGVLHCLPHILPMYAPSINSYKRLVEGAWAPTTITWGKDNRTTAVRVLPGSPKSTRIEMRVPGSDTNPYLVMAASLASGLYGIEKGLTLDQPQTVGNGYEDFKNGTLPRNLWEATDAMKKSEVAGKLFGAEFVDHFCRTRDWEWREFSKVVTDWEMKRYFEII